MDVGELLAACTRAGFALDLAGLREVVARNDKQRFAFDESGARLRAQQGHSVEVDLGLEAAEPPAILYHGTGAGSVAPILGSGLLKMGRHHVHLSADVATAIRVGGRRGKPAVFAVNAAAMRAAGSTFHRSGNGVWLVEAVPPRYLELMET